MSQSVDCELLLYADDSCLVFTDKSLSTIENSLNKNFNSLCDWFVENKLSIHFGEDKTKSIVFGTKMKLRNLNKLVIKRNDIQIKQQTEVTYLGCILDNNLSGEPMATKTINKISGRLKFLYRKQSFLNLKLKRLLCNALIQPHFDYASSAWYSNLNKKLKSKIQITQNKCIRFCLGLGNRTHIGFEEFKNINWLPSKERFEQCVSVGIYKLCNNLSPVYMTDIYTKTDTRYALRKGVHKLIELLNC